MRSWSLSTTTGHTLSMTIATFARWVSWYRCATEGDIKEVLNNRLKELNMMGVKFVSSAQYLNLDVRVFSNQGTKREGKFSVMCNDTDRDMPLFNLDAFDNAKDALNWAKVFVEFFLKHGVRVCVTLHCTEDVLELLNGQVQNMKIEIDNLFDKPNEQ